MSNPTVREALRFYSDDISYITTQMSEPRTAVHGDKGKRARAALETLGAPPAADRVLAVAKAIEGPHQPVDPASSYTLAQLRDIRWENLSNHARNLRLQEAKAALGEIEHENIVTITRDFSERIVNDRTVKSVFKALNDEVDELDVEVTAVWEGQPEGEDGVVGESIDVMLCALDLIFQHQPDITQDEINVIARRKCEKWARKYG